MKITKVTNLLKVLVIGTLVVIASRVPFLHKKYEFINSKYSIEYKSHNAKYKPIIKKRDNSFASLLVGLENGTITKEDYVQKIKSAKKESEIELKSFNDKRNALKNGYKYRGFNAYYFFLLTIGTPIMALVLCLLFFYVLMNPVTLKTKKIVFSIYGSLFLFTSSYFVLHALYAEQVYKGDFPDNWYKNIMRYVPILVSFTIPLLFYHYQNMEIKLKFIINKLIVFIRKSEDEYIDSKEKKKKHFEDSFDLYEEIVED